jgi:conjugal transfer pilus assembly protein TraW
MKRLSPLALILLALPVTASAVSLGVIGPTYPIQEQNLLAFIQERLQEKARSGELEKREEEARRRSVAAVENPSPVLGLSPTVTARTFYYDPTYTLDHNIFDDKGRLLFPAGTKKNPLEIVSLSKHLLFFDARDHRQVVLARRLMDRYGGHVKPILVGGSFLDLMKVWKTPVYYDQRGTLTRRLQITHVPALVSQDGLRLRIDELTL